MRHWINWLLLIGLAVSVGVNVYLVSATARDARSSHQEATTTIERRLERMPPEDAAILRDAFADHRPEIEARNRQLKTARAAARDLLRQERLDQAALAAALAELRSKTLAVQETFHQVYIVAAPRLSAEGRRRLFVATRRLPGVKG